MSLRRINLVMEIDPKRGPEDFVQRCPAVVFETLSPVVSPWFIGYSLADRDLPDLVDETPQRHGVSRIVVGEEVTDAAFSGYQPAAGTALVDRLRRELSGTTERTIGLTSRNAVLHRAPGADAARWLARHRWSQSTSDKPASGLEDFCTVNVMWGSVGLYEVEVSFPLDGYPLTECRLTEDGAVEEADAESALENRARLFPVLGQLREALQLPREAVRWSESGDWSHRYPEADRDLRERWLPYLQSR